MRRMLAAYLRSIADRIDPQELPPVYFDLHEVDGVEAGRLISEFYDLRGFPRFFWPIGNNGFRVWPKPDGKYQLAVRAEGDRDAEKEKANAS